MKRRTFIAGAAAAVCAGPAACAGRPVLRFGIMTDTHVTSDPRSFARAEAAFAVFRARECDMFCHLGDLAERCDPEAHRMWRAAVRKAFPDRKPKEIYVYAAHDFYDFEGKRWKLSPAEQAEAYASFRRNAGLPNGPYAELDVNGIPFVVVPQHVTRDEFSAMIARAEAKHPHGPVFTLNHVAPENTTFNSSDWGCWWTPALLSRHPRTVNLSGHTHGTVANERNIWQGGFTSVDAGCLSKWVSALPGRQSKAKDSYGVLVCDVFADRLVFRRIDVRDNAEIRPPWTVPLPFDPATAPYTEAARRAAAPLPAFPASAKPVVDVSSGKDVVVRFPAAENADEVFCYRVEAAKRGVLLDWETIAREDVYGEFHLRAHERKNVLESVFPRTALNKNRPCRFTVTPVGFHGRAGVPLETTLILR